MQVVAESKRLIRDSSILLVIVVLGFFLQYGLNITLARWLKAELYGDYSVAITVIQFCATLILLGSDSAIMYFLPTYITVDDWGKAHGYLRHFGRLIFKISLIIIVSWIIIFGSVMLLVHHRYLQFSHLHIVIFAFWLIPFFAVISFLAKLLRSFKHAYLSLIPSNIGYQLLLLSIIFLFIAVTGKITIYHTLFAIGFVALFVIIIQLIFVKQTLPNHLLSEKPHYVQKLWLKVSLQLMLTALIISGIQGIDLIILEILHPVEEDVGRFSALMVIGNSMWVIYQAAVVVFSPLISPAVHANNQNKLQTLFNISSLVTVIPLSILTVLLVVFGKAVLLHFGSDFANIYKELVIMIVGFLIIVSTNMSLLFLQYSGHQGVLLGVLTALLFITITLDAIFILWLGLMGAVISLIVSGLILNISCVILAKKHLKINPFIFV